MSQLQFQKVSNNKNRTVNEWKHQIVASTVPETQLVPCYKALITGPSDTISFCTKYYYFIEKMKSIIFFNLIFTFIHFSSS